MQPNRDALIESSEICRRLSVGASPDAKAILQNMEGDFQRRAELEPQDYRRSYLPPRPVFWGAISLLTVAYFGTAYWLKALDPIEISPMVRGRIVGLQRPFVSLPDSKFGVMAPDYWFGDVAGSLPQPCRSPVRIYENDKLLGPNHATVRSIGMVGKGRSEHWRSGDGPDLYSSNSIFFFSASDNTNPQTNGRSYWAVLPDDETASACPANDPASGEPEEDLFFAPPPSGQLAVQMKPPFETFARSHMFVFHDVDPLAKLADDQDNKNRSPVQLYENYNRIGIPHSNHTDIATLGQGRYSHWKTQGMVFSSSDNSDPNTNGRTYWAVVPYEQRPSGTTD